jgi:hypothetical protein
MKNEPNSLTSHKSLASTIVPDFRPISDQDAVTVAFDELLFHKTTATLLLLRGPAQTYIHRIFSKKLYARTMIQFSHAYVCI